jgi:SulP family sulfate permease
MIPESLSFAILAGFPPLVGLYAAFIMGLVTAIFGGDLEWYLVVQGQQ